MSRWSDDSAICVVYAVRFYSVLDTVVISGEYVCCGVVLGTLVGVSVVSVMWRDTNTLTWWQRYFQVSSNFLRSHVHQLNRIY